MAPIPSSTVDPRRFERGLAAGVDVARAGKDPNLRGLDLKAADVDGNGVVSGKAELAKLYAQSQSKDTFEQLERHPVLLSEQRPSAGTVGTRLAEEGNRSLNDRTDAHRTAIEKTGIGAYHGSESSFAALPEAEKKTWVDARKTPGTDPAASKPSHCLDWSMEHVGAAYKAAGREARWKQIEKAVHAHGDRGTVLARELQKDGWKGIYFNPDTKHPADGDKEHAFTAKQAKKGEPYYGLRVDGRVTDYRPTAGEGTKEDRSGLSALEKVPFFFGVARGGQHTFVGQYGRTNELHWDAQPNDKKAIEEKSLAEFPWLSGMVMVPPGTWPKK